MTESQRARASARFIGVFGTLLAHRMTQRERTSQRLCSLIRDAYIRGWIDRGIDIGEPIPDRVMPKPRITHAGDTHAHVQVTSYASNLAGTGTPDTDTPDLELLHLQQLTFTGENIGEREGAGGETTPDDFGIMVPAELAAFDATLRKLGKRYKPTNAFYERVVRQFVGIVGLDLVYEADGLVTYCTETPKGRTRVDIPRTAENWLSNALERAQRVHKPRGYGNQSRGSGYNGMRPFGMGNASDEARAGAKEYMRRNGYGSDNT